MITLSFGFLKQIEVNGEGILIFARPGDPGPRLLWIRRRFRAPLSKQRYIRGSGGIDNYKKLAGQESKFYCRLLKNEIAEKLLPQTHRPPEPLNCHPLFFYLKTPKFKTQLGGLSM